MNRLRRIGPLFLALGSLTLLSPTGSSDRRLASATCLESEPAFSRTPPKLSLSRELVEDVGQIAQEETLRRQYLEYFQQNSLDYFAQQNAVRAQYGLKGTIFGPFAPINYGSPFMTNSVAAGNATANLGYSYLPSSSAAYDPQSILWTGIPVFGGWGANTASVAAPSAVAPSIALNQTTPATRSVYGGAVNNARVAAPSISAQ